MDKKAGSEGESTFRKSSHSLPATLPVLLLGYQSLRMNKTGETKGTRKHTQQVWCVKHIRYSRWEKAGGCQHSQETIGEMEVPGNRVPTMRLHSAGSRKGWGPEGRVGTAL